jgi:hypothetical protein
VHRKHVDVEISKTFFLFFSLSLSSRTLPRMASHDEKETRRQEAITEYDKVLRVYQELRVKRKQAAKAKKDEQARIRQELYIEQCNREIQQAKEQWIAEARTLAQYGEWYKLWGKCSKRHSSCCKYVSCDDPYYLTTNIRLAFRNTHTKGRPKRVDVCFQCFQTSCEWCPELFNPDDLFCPSYVIHSGQCRQFKSVRATECMNDIKARLVSARYTFARDRLALLDAHLIPVLAQIVVDYCFY